MNERTPLTVADAVWEHIEDVYAVAQLHPDAPPNPYYFITQYLWPLIDRLAVPGRFEKLEGMGDPRYRIAEQGYDWGSLSLMVKLEGDGSLFVEKAHLILNEH